MKNNILNSLKNKFEQTKTEEKQIQQYFSTFDFASNEISESDRMFLVEKEQILIKQGKVNSDSLYQICITLLEVSDRFKNNGERKFMKWYEHIGLNKDRVSELLKRAHLYINYPEKKNLISSLPTQSVKILTKKDIELKEVQKILELGYTAVMDIKNNITNLNDDEKIKMKSFKYFDVKSIQKIQKDIKKMDSKEIFNAKKEIEIYKKLLKEAEKQLEEKEKDYDNQNNLKLLEAE
ncbi:MAG: hypothetical protein RR795_01520 [Cetobacterium sp.]|uniref:hypothetical protein n=1 Tax=Cetobacterium sp. TaxID=2071632 RepID=UPI002FCB7945